MKNDRTIATTIVLSAALLAITACSSRSDSFTPQPQLPASIGLDGVVSDGPVVGGTIYAMSPEQLAAGLADVVPGDELHDALTTSNVVGHPRDPGDADQYSIDVPARLARRVVFLILDREGAEDLEFGDTPPYLMSIAVLGDAGSRQRVNISLHTSIVAQQLWAQLDPDGDGSVVDDGQLLALLQTAELNALGALGRDRVGRELFDDGHQPFDDDDDDAVHEASSALGLLVRELAAATGLDVDAILAALAADAADGTLDGSIPAFLNPSEELEALAAMVREHAGREDDDDYAMFAVGPCSSSAVALRRACAADIVDDGFESRAICADIADDDDRLECLAEAAIADEENAEECDAVLDARLAICEATGDASHDPIFGELFVANFVDPTLIGASVEPNPFFPLVAGNRWTYESEAEVIVVEVLNETKLIDGVTCVTVNDVVMEDGQLIEDTDDWYAQDVSGNVYYCGEIALNYELFEGDDPELAELVDIEGSWKHGRDGAEAGMLLPFDPVVGTTIRQEVLFGEAEDVVDILSVTASESSPGGSCTDTCLQTRDYTPLEPDVEEFKFYLPGVGLIVEVDPDSGERLELVEFSPGD